MRQEQFDNLKKLLEERCREIDQYYNDLDYVEPSRREPVIEELRRQSWFLVGALGKRLNIMILQQVYQTYIKIKAVPRLYD